MMPNRRFVILLTGFLLGIFLSSRISIAQTEPTNSASQSRKSIDKSQLDTILARMDDNIDEFNRTVPSFFSKEEVSSEEEPSPSGARSLRTHTSSTFIVRRAGDPDDPNDPARDSDNSTESNSLHESRFVRTIDEKGFVTPMKHAKQSDTTTRMDSPYVVFGIFSGGMTRISTPGKTCFHYRLHPAREGHDGGRIVINFESWPRKDRGANCPYEDQISGRGFIDPATMRIMRLENVTRDDRGTWTWSVDYAPIALGEKTFWLPITIRSEDISVVNTASPTGRDFMQTTFAHHLVARYSHYRQAKAPAPSR